MNDTQISINTASVSKTVRRVSDLESSTKSLRLQVKTLIYLPSNDSGRQGQLCNYLVTFVAQQISNRSGLTQGLMHSVLTATAWKDIEPFINF